MLTKRPALIWESWRALSTKIHTSVHLIRDLPMQTYSEALWNRAVADLPRGHSSCQRQKLLKLLEIGEILNKLCHSQMLEQYANMRNHIFEIFHDTKKRSRYANHKAFSMTPNLHMYTWGRSLAEEPLKCTVFSVCWDKGFLNHLLWCAYTFLRSGYIL